MNAEQFNALPLEARRYIENETACLSCGKSNNLDLLYQKYLKMKNDNLFTLRIGAVNFFNEKTNESGILYPILPKDTDAEIKEKLKLALKINKANPEMFTTINEVEIAKILKTKNEVSND